MKNKQQIGHGKYTFPIMLSVVFLALALSLGNTFARYQISQEMDVALENTAPADQVYLLDGAGGFQSPGDWVYDKETQSYALDFRLCNGLSGENYASKNQEVSLAVMATVADSAANKETQTLVTLSVGSEDYVGVPSPIIKGTVFWKQYGEGQIYRFYNGAGEEIRCTLVGGQLSEVPMRLTVTGSEPNTAYTLMTDRVIIN